MAGVFNIRRKSEHQWKELKMRWKKNWLLTCMYGSQGGIASTWICGSGIPLTVCPPEHNDIHSCCIFYSELMISTRSHFVNSIINPSQTLAGFQPEQEINQLTAAPGVHCVSSPQLPGERWLSGLLSHSTCTHTGMGLVALIKCQVSAFTETYGLNIMILIRLMNFGFSLVLIIWTSNKKYRVLLGNAVTGSKTAIITALNQRLMGQVWQSTPVQVQNKSNPQKINVTTFLEQTEPIAFYFATSNIALDHIHSGNCHTPVLGGSHA